MKCAYCGGHPGDGESCQNCGAPVGFKPLDHSLTAGEYEEFLSTMYANLGLATNPPQSDPLALYTAAATQTRKPTRTFFSRDNDRGR